MLVLSSCSPSCKSAQSRGKEVVMTLTLTGSSSSPFLSFAKRAITLPQLLHISLLLL